MKPPRTSDDKVLALLARVARPLERGEIAELLGWSKQRVGAVLSRLVPDERVVATAGTKSAAENGGRPPSLYSLRGMEPARPSAPSAPYFEPKTVVLTPSEREARVIGMRPGGFVEIEYLHVRIGHEPRATVHATLLRAFQAGREKPLPVRIATPDPSPT